MVWVKSSDTYLRGRAVTLLRSTIYGRFTIVPQLDEGSLVTIPRHFADMVITEWGIARLAGKSHRERTAELTGRRKA